MHTSAFLAWGFARDCRFERGEEAPRKSVRARSRPRVQHLSTGSEAKFQRNFELLGAHIGLAGGQGDSNADGRRRNLGQLQGLLDQLVAKPKETVEFQYSFFNYSPETNALRGEVDTEFIHTGLTVYGPTIQRSLFRRRWRTGSSRWRRRFTNWATKPSDGRVLSATFFKRQRDDVIRQA